jgi:nitrogen fixation/metabolism regulation signal transduction histidine kinase
MSHAEAILSALRKPVVVVSRALEVDYANDAFTALLGRSGSPEPGRLGTAIRSTPALASALGRSISKLRAVGWTSEARWATGADDGRIFDVRVVRMAEDRYAAVLDDVTHHLRVQEIQSRARSYLEAVLNRLPLGVIVLDGDLNVTYFNPAQAELFGRLGVERSLFEVIGAHVADSYPVFDIDEWRGVHARVVRSGETVVWNKVGHPRDQPIRYFMINLVPLDRHAEAASGAICITDEVTRTVALEKELLEKERLALVGQMAIALNHEINNPLTAIFGCAETLLFNGGLSREQVGRLETIRENSLRIVDVTRRLREVEDVHLTEYVRGGPLMIDLGHERAEIDS